MRTEDRAGGGRETGTEQRRNTMELRSGSLAVLPPGIELVVTWEIRLVGDR